MVGRECAVALISGALLISAGCASGRRANPTQSDVEPDRPANILILLADDLGVDAVGAYGEGAAPPPTPNLDALAARGVLFRNAWANPVCSPTRAAIMTGRYSFRTGIGGARFRGGPRLRLAETTIPEAFDAAQSGYTHAAFGKWHLSEERDAPVRAGWGYAVEGPFLQVRDYYDWPRRSGGVVQPSTRYLTSQLVDEALDWIGRQEGPWIGYVAFYSPHGPWMAPPPDLHTQDLSAAGGRKHSPVYFKATVEALDSEIGRLLAGLGPELSRTNVIFLSDNGTPGIVTEPPFDPSHAKGTAYEGGLNVPLLVAGPAVDAPGRESTALVGAVDLLATVLDLAGTDVADVLEVPYDSVSFAPVLRDRRHPPVRSMVFAERFPSPQWRTMDARGFAATRDRRYKLVRDFASDRDELYDLKKDRFEQRDLLWQAGSTRSLNSRQRRAYEALSGEIERLRSTASFRADLTPER